MILRRCGSVVLELEESPIASNVGASLSKEPERSSSDVDDGRVKCWKFCYRPPSPAVWLERKARTPGWQALGLGLSADSQAGPRPGYDCARRWHSARVKYHKQQLKPCLPTSPLSSAKINVRKKSPAAETGTGNARGVQGRRRMERGCINTRDLVGPMRTLGRLLLLQDRGNELANLQKLLPGFLGIIIVSYSLLPIKLG